MHEVLWECGLLGAGVGFGFGDGWEGGEIWGCGMVEGFVSVGVR